MDIDELERRYAEAATKAGNTTTEVAPNAMDGGMAFEHSIAWDVPTFIEAPYNPLGTPLDADVAIVGLPYEGIVQIDHAKKFFRGTAGAPNPNAMRPRFGANDAPAAIRVGSLAYSLGFSGGEIPEIGVTLTDHLKIVDVGDADVRGGTMEEAWDTAAAAIAEVLSAGAVPMTLGGDHTITGMALAGIHAARPDLRIAAVVLDSHLDVANKPKIGASAFWYRAFRSGVLEPSNLCPIGIRGKTLRGWDAVVEALELPFRTMADIDRDGIVEIARQALAAVTSDVDALYISLDTDVIDPAFQPGQKLPDSAGLTAREVMLGLRTLVTESPVPIVGFDVAEYSPHYDYRHQGAITVARSVVEVIGGLAVRKAATAVSSAAIGASSN
jgi:arginase family enzyme